MGGEFDAPCHSPISSAKETGVGTEGEGQGLWLCSTEWENGSGLIYGDPRERDRGRKGR